MSIEDLKKSVEMTVWNGGGKKTTRTIIHIDDNDQTLDDYGDKWDNYEEIKEPTWRPYTKDDDIPIGWLSLLIHSKIEKNTYHIISGISNTGFSIHGEWHTFDVLFEEWETLDGKPIGVKE